MKEQPQKQQQDTAASTTMMLRGTDQHRGLQAPPRSKNKNPINEDKDAAARPFDADQAFKGTDSFQQRPSAISYFPDQVLQISYIVSVLDKDSHTSSSLARTTNSGVVSNPKNKNGDNGNSGRHSHPQNVLSNDKLFLTDLKEALDVLATELAPAAYPDLWVREITTSIDRFFPLVCPAGTNLANCQDITSTIGIYLSPKPQNLTGEDVSEVQNLYGANESSTRNKNNAIDPSTLSAELLAFETSLQEAMANNRLQEIIEGFYGVGVSGGPAVDPPVYVVPSTPIVSGEDVSNDGGSGNDGNQGSNNGKDSNQNGNNAGDDSDSGGDGGNENGPAPETVEGGDSGDDEEPSDPIDDVNKPSNPGNNDGDSPNNGNQENGDGVDDNTEGGDNFQIGGGGDTGSEYSPDSENEVMPGGDGDDEETNGINDEDENVGTSDESDGVTGSDGNPAWLPTDPTDTSSGGGALPANGANTVNGDSSKGGLNTGAIVGIALAAVAVVVVALCCLRRLKRKNQRSGKSRSGDSSRKSKSQKSATEESISNDSSNKGSLGRFLYAGVQGESRSDTNHSRDTVPTVSASSSTMSENTSHSAASTAAYGGRRTEQWKTDEVLVPMNTSRGLLVLDRVDEEKSSSEGENDPNDPLVGFGEVSDLYIPPGDDEVFEMEACVALSSSSSSSGGSLNGDEDVEAYIVPSPASSRRPSNGSRSSSESPLKAMAARSLRALRGNNRSIERSKQELEDVLSGQGFHTNDEEDDLEVIQLSPEKAVDESQGSAMTNVRPLSSLDEAIMNGDWAAVGATAALMAASLSPEDKAKRPESRPIALNSPPPEKAELDRLIEQGNWQAVMIAAAQYDAEGGATSSMGDETSGTRSRTSTQGSDTLDGSYWSGNDHSSAYNSTTTRGSAQTSASQKEKLEEIRAQVEQLVRDVVPDEAENVDEMMDQFQGKEEELLETLRTMKERDVAKKARMESQKIARRNTRSKEKEKKEGVPHVDEVSPTIATKMPTTVFGQSAGPPAESGDDDDSDFSPEPAAAPFQSSFGRVVTKKGGDDSAAAAAAEWAIERRLSELMEKDQNNDSEPIHTIV